MSTQAYFVFPVIVAHHISKAYQCKCKKWSVSEECWVFWNHLLSDSSPQFLISLVLGPFHPLVLASQCVPWLTLLLHPLSKKSRFKGITLWVFLFTTISFFVPLLILIALHCIALFLFLYWAYFVMGIICFYGFGWWISI